MSDNIATELAKPLDPKHIKSRSQAGQTLSYIEGWRAIAEANEVFGWDGWNRETLVLGEARPAELVGDKWRVGYMAKVRVVAGRAVRDGTGYGSGIAKDLGDAHESAAKEAETDATKRALMTFGWRFGLALYDKARAHVGTTPETGPETPHDPETGEVQPPPNVAQRATQGLQETWKDIALRALPRGEDSPPNEKARAFADLMISDIRGYKSMHGLSAYVAGKQSYIKALAKYPAMYQTVTDANDLQEKWIQNGCPEDSFDTDPSKRMPAFMGEGG
jgi:DNA repair and recombination protein RAD52